MMKRLLFLFFMVVTTVVMAMAKGDKFPEYDITGAGSGSEGTLLVKVYVYAKNVTDNDLKRAAAFRVAPHGHHVGRGKEEGAHHR